MCYPLYYTNLYYTNFIYDNNRFMDSYIDFRVKDENYNLNFEIPD